MNAKKRFKKDEQTSVKGRSSALIVTVVLHSTLLVLAGILVAVTINQEPPIIFKPFQIEHPKIPPPKLQVPVKTEAGVPKVVTHYQDATRIKTDPIDIPVPNTVVHTPESGVEIDRSGLGSLGFATSQIKIFDTDGNGDKFLFALDTSRDVLVDEIGGIDAYKIIKDELIDSIIKLSPVKLFNVAVFDANGCQAFSREMCSATDDNIKRLKTWLAPLNSNKTKWGRATLASPGALLSFEPMAPVMNSQRGWVAALSYAIQNGVDCMYWLGADDRLAWIHKDFYDQVKRGKPLGGDNGRYDYSEDLSRYPGGEAAWRKLVSEARAKFDAENKERLAKGEPVKVIAVNGTEQWLVRTYFPGAPLPETADKLKGQARYDYTAQDLLAYIDAMQKKYGSAARRVAAIGLKKTGFSINVIHFVPKVQGSAQGRTDYELDRVKELAGKMNGQYVRIAGLDAIRSSAEAN